MSSRDFNLKYINDGSSDKKIEEQILKLDNRDKKYLENALNSTDKIIEVFNEVVRQDKNTVGSMTEVCNLNFSLKDAELFIENKGKEEVIIYETDLP